jgi:carbon-monoxide dehydrogenase small subunit
MKHEVNFEVNGRPTSVVVEGRKTLADALREDCGLTGTHLGCEHGVCGACTVLLDDEPVRSCLLFAVQCQGHSVRTVEGLATDESLHPLQEKFSEHHGLQCGFCTPGFLMLSAWIAEQDEVPDDATLREQLSSNLCRCTGYQNIVSAVKDAATALHQDENS